MDVTAHLQSGFRAVEKAFRLEATTDDKQAAAGILRRLLAHLEGTNNTAAEPTTAVSESTNPAASFRDMFLERLLARLPDDQRSQLEADDDDNAIPLVALPRF